MAPAVLEDRLRAHPLVSQCIVVGDGKPFIAALVTVDTEALPGWLERSGKDTGTAVADLVDDPDLRNAIGEAVAEANQAVSRAEQIREFRILPADFSESGGWRVYRTLVHSSNGVGANSRIVGSVVSGRFTKRVIIFDC